MELLSKIIDDRFDLEKLDQYELHIEIQISRFKFYLINKVSHTVFWLEDYSVKREYHPAVYIDRIIKLYEEHTFLKASFWHKIFITYDTPLFLKFSLDFFDETKTHEYFHIQFPEIDFDHYVLKFEKIESEVCLYAFPKKLHDFLKSTYQLKEPIIQNRLCKISRSFGLNIKTNEYNWIILGEKWFDIFYKSISTNHILFKKLPFTPKNFQEGLDLLIKSGGIKTLVWGEITPYSKSYNKIKSKIKSAEIGKSFTNKKFTRDFEDLPSQRHFSLFL